MKKTNEPMIPSTGVKDATTASGSKPRSNTKKDRTFLAKIDKKKVEDHSRKNKSSVKQTNRVDSSISYKRTVINSNSNSVCKTCNKCLMSFNHDKCVVKSLKFVKQTPVKKPTGRKFTLGEQCPLTMFTKSKVVPVKQSESVSTSDIVITERLSNTSQKPLTRTPTEIRDPTYQPLHIHLFSNAGRTYRPLFIGTVRFGNDHFGAIMGYGDYVIGDSVISMVYYMEGLGHNLFSIEQFCDSDLEVAFRKHSCYVRDVNGVNLIKGSHGTNLYTISVEDMMKSSPICLLSKASKNKSWFWHRRIFHKKSVLRTPQQNDVVERWNRTLVEAARTMLIFSKAPMFLWAEAIATAC
ncbi:integrase, catalytic region, zinc finger, CCHC-type containing protein, partial [Tanacetum coccineum]